MDISKDLNTIRAELFTHIESVQEEYISKGFLPAKMNLNNGVIRGLIEIFIWGIWQLYQFLDFVMKQATPNNATGQWLDLHAESVDLTRKPATKAYGNISFARTAGSTDNIKISAGKIVRTPADAQGRVFRYVVSEDTVLPSGQDSIVVPVIAEEYGSAANAVAGLIRELVTPVNGISSVNNTEGWLTSEGADEETDSLLFARYKLQWQAQAGVTSAAYAFAALSVTGVAGVKIFDQHPRGQGTVDIVVLGTGGEPTDTLLDAVAAAVQSTIIINDDVLVKAVELLPLSLSLTIEYLGGSADEIKTRAEADILEKIAAVSDTIGADLILARIISDVINMDNIKRVIWHSPAADVTVSSSQIFQLTSLNITMELVDED